MDEKSSLWFEMSANCKIEFSNGIGSFRAGRNYWPAALHGELNQTAASPTCLSLPLHNAHKFTHRFLPEDSRSPSCNVTLRFSYICSMLYLYNIVNPGVN